MTKTIFSALFNESAEYFNVFIENFMHYTDQETILIVNLGCEADVAINCDYGLRVHIVRGSVRRAKWGATLLAGHMENFREAEQVFPDFRWFITMASNSLFFHPFDMELALDALLESKAQCPDVQWDSLPNHWHWPRLTDFYTAAQYLFKRLGTSGLWNGQIEGRLASRKDWALVADVSAESSGCWNGLEAPLEELLPVTVISAIGSGQTISICHVKWEPPEERIVRIEDLINPINEANYVCLMKWFRRDPRALETLIVGAPLGRSLLRTLQETEPTSQKADNIEWLLRGFLSKLEARQVWVPFQLSTKPGDFPWGPPLELTANEPTLCTLNGGPPVEDEPYIFISSLGLWLKISLNLVAQGRVIIKCTARPVSKETTVPKTLLGYLFFPTPMARRLRLFGIVHGVTAADMIQEIMWKEERTMLLSPLQSSITGKQFVIDYGGHQKGPNGSIGFPMHDGMEIDIQFLFDKSTQNA
jgi:hypothetical protein